MKTFRMGVCAIFVSMLIGCGIPYGNFSTENPVIINKEQDIDQKFHGDAKYKIRFNPDGKDIYSEYWYIFPENFGNVGDSIVFSNKMMYAKSPKTKKLEE